MFHFIVCDNDSHFLQKLKKALIENEQYESITTFKEYTDSFFKIVYDESIKNKFYILDIETYHNNGIVVAQKIRKFDQNSIIVFMTGYEKEYSYRISKSRLRYDALINKFDDFESELQEVIMDHKKDVGRNRCLTIEINSNTSCVIDLNDLLYIKTEKSTQKLIFQTKKQQFSTYESLNKFEDKLNSDFIKVNRSCIVNKKLAHFDFKNNVVNFENVKLKDVMSQSYIKKQAIS